MSTDCTGLAAATITMYSRPVETNHTQWTVKNNILNSRISWLLTINTESSGGSHAEQTKGFPSPTPKGYDYDY